MEFPVPTHPEGFGTTVRPGRITWQKEAGNLQAVTGSDMLPTWEVRKTYRFDRHQGGFVIIRVEVQRVPGPDEWTTLWDAPRWSLPEVKQ